MDIVLFISFSEYKCVISGMGGWVIFSILMVVMHAIKVVFPPFAIIFSMRYNSPAVMLNWARQWKIQSNVVNWISVSVLSVYIIHMGSFSGYYFFDFVERINNNLPSVAACLSMVSFMIVCYIVCILIDKVRILICTPIIKWLTNKLMMMVNICWLQKKVK